MDELGGATPSRLRRTSYHLLNQTCKKIGVEMHTKCAHSGLLEGARLKNIQSLFVLAFLFLFQAK